ncbi:hypothetical protein CBER1_07402 [Cercospora berteroae]|uniref:Heterokaryon incompatibility domain-containing protein n=1 Tax=Cercospora berteroae TaxID=357750 RepID=A0A2S6CMW7_9PEZI|nr:hypothetical protein CBER1_07402 [Cercospora berteroae]
MPFFSRKKKPEVLVAQNRKTSALHHSGLQQVQQQVLPITSQQDPRRKKVLRPEVKEIRLLCLLPGKGVQPLCCRIKHTALEVKRGQEKYETVSYCWGQNPGRTYISIDGVPVQVTESSSRVLQRLRHPTHERTVWIDAICIDQSNNEEKGSQVSFMSDIYRKGSTNVVWLGDCAPLDAERIATTIRKVVANMRQATHDFKDMSYIMYGAGSKNVDGKLLDTRIDLGPLLILFSRPWFGRLWVAQEATLSTTSICHLGQESFLLTDVLLVAAWLGYNRQQVPAELDSLQGLAAARAMWYLRNIRPWDIKDLYMIYTLTRNFQATESRDHVFALLSMYDVQVPQLNVQQRLLMPSYGESGKPLHEVFRDATRAAIEDGRHLCILHFVDPFVALPGMPTWALRFDRRTVDDHNRVCRASGFHATADTILQFLPCKNPDILALRGMTIAEVGQMSEICPVQQKWANGARRAFMNEVYAMMRMRAEDRSDELASTLIGGVNLKHERARKPDFEDFRAFQKYSKRYPNKEPSSQMTDDTSVRAARWYRASEKAMLNSRFFVTTEGRSGIGPPLMSAGKYGRDRIVALFGGPALLVLRPLGNDQYLFIGECYLHGCMYGDTVKARITAQIPAEPFYIL